MSLDRIERAVADLAAGRPVVVVDDENRENEGDLVFAAELATSELVAFMMREARGLICVPMVGEDVDRLELEQMVGRNTESMRTAFTVSVDAAEGTTTGISAADRARTIRLLADPRSTPDQFVRPGHVFPLRARPGGVLERPGHTEAGPDLCRLAGLRPAAVICEIANPDGTMARLPQLREFANLHGLALVSIEDLIEFRRERERRVVRAAETALPTTHGAFRAYGYVSEPDGVEHVALVTGEVDDADEVLVRIHSECLTGDVFGSLRCDCGPQLAEAMDRIAEEGRGIVLYLRGHEGRGIGLVRKLKAYQLQEAGHDTVDANLELGLPADSRDYSAAAGMLADLGVRSIRLLTNNPDKGAALEAEGIKITAREPLPTTVGEHNVRYLRTKRDRMGHDLPWLA
ncbi:bifunctional 3,4-dihydroxy-2-butanone-4-phosphate synthase/GTP cyclohydrolase II [Streptacidiphilus monticola]|uniref:Riboflavin biosynthesis protein RibBA n=1 Tax=Streptacidiphilus monticola TaxID=2161674 RepID=A0ABW1FWR3_9ACTN